MANDAAILFDAISDAIEELPDDVRDQLGIYSLVKIDAKEYLAVDSASS